VTCDPGYAITNLSVYATNYLDGYITITCYYLGDLLNTGSEAWEDSTLETCDNCWHYAHCSSNRVARGIKIYASSRLDTQMQLLCTSIASGTSDAGTEWTVTGSNDENDDDIMYGISCPAGSYLSNLAIYANSYLDGDLRVICRAPK